MLSDSARPRGLGVMRSPTSLLRDIRLVLDRPLTPQPDGTYAKQSRLSWRDLVRSYMPYRKARHNPQEWEIIRANGQREYRRTLNLRTNAGLDFQAKALGGDVVFGANGTSTGTSATTLTDSGASWTTNAFVGHIVGVGSAYGVILSNTPTGLVIDRWNAAGNPGGSAASTPGATSAYQILPGQAPAIWIALSTNAALSPAVTDTTLSSETSAAGLARKTVTFAHTVAATNYKLTVSFQNTSGGLVTVYGAGNLNAQNGGVLFLESTMTSAALQDQDQLQLVSASPWQVNL